MGDPTQAGELILKGFIAPPTQQDKIAELIAAEELPQGDLVEYTVYSVSKGWKRHNLAVYGTKNDVLYTLNCQCPEDR